MAKNQSQMTIYDFLEVKDYTKPPKFEWGSVNWKLYPGLDVYYKAFPETPVYLVVKSMRPKWTPLYARALICTYTGWWHALQGWNVDNGAVEYWEQIPNEQIKDWARVGHPKLGWTPEEWDEVKDLPLEEIIKIAKKREVNLNV